MSQIYFKTMRREFYQEGQTLDTSIYNYSKAIGTATEADKCLYHVILQVSDISGVSFETLTLFARMTQSRMLPNPNELLDQLEISDKQLKVDLRKYVPVSEGESVVGGELLNLLIIASLKCDIEIGSKHQSASFWEYLYEIVRARYCPNAPRRLQSFFAFQDASSISRYRERHGLGDIECKVDGSQCHTAFSADMTVLDEIDGRMNFAKALPEVVRYWRQEHSEAPVIEVLLQGKVKILNRIK